jgi:hypothetical protein
MQLRSDLLNAGTATRWALEVSPRSLLQNEFIQRQIGNALRSRGSETGFLFLIGVSGFSGGDLDGMPLPSAAFREWWNPA